MYTVKTVRDGSNAGPQVNIELNLATTRRLQSISDGQDCQVISAESPSQELESSPVQTSPNSTEGSYVSLLAGSRGQESLTMIGASGNESIIDPSSLSTYPNIALLETINAAGDEENVHKYLILQSASSNGANTDVSDNKEIVDSNKELRDAVANISEPLNDTGPCTAQKILINNQGIMQTMQTSTDQSNIIFNTTDLQSLQLNHLLPATTSYCIATFTTSTSMSKPVSAVSQSIPSSRLQKFRANELLSIGQSEKEILSSILKTTKLKTGRPKKSQSSISVDVDEVEEIVRERYTSQKCVGSFEKLGKEVEDITRYSNSAPNKTTEIKENKTKDDVNESVQNDIVLESSKHTLADNSEIIPKKKVKQNETKKCIFEDNKKLQGRSKFNKNSKIEEIVSFCKGGIDTAKTKQDSKLIDATRIENLDEVISQEKNKNVTKRPQRNCSKFEILSKEGKKSKSKKKSRKSIGDKKSESDSVEDSWLQQFLFDDKWVLQIGPLSLKTLKNKHIVIDMEVSDDLVISEMEKTGSSKGVSKYSFTVSCNNERKKSSKVNENVSSKTEKNEQVKKIRAEKRDQRLEKDGNKMGETNVGAEVSQVEGVDEKNTQENCEINVSMDAFIANFNKEIQFLELNSASDDRIDGYTMANDKFVAETETENNTETSKADGYKIENIRSKGQKKEGKPNKNYIIRTTEAGSKEFVCPLCGYFSKYSQNVATHVTEHSNTKDWVCEECGLRWKSKNRLQKHMVVHQKERPFSCPLCTQAFKSQPIFKQHLKRHLGLKKFICEHCSKGFVTRGDLNKHIRCHTGVTPYKCSMCQRAFSDLSALYRHIKDIHMKIKQFMCALCKKKFSRKEAVHKHLQKSHMDEINYENNVQLELWVLDYNTHQDQLST